LIPQCFCLFLVLSVPVPAPVPAPVPVPVPAPVPAPVPVPVPAPVPAVAVAGAAATPKGVHVEAKGEVKLDQSRNGSRLTGNSAGFPLGRSRSETELEGDVIIDYFRRGLRPENTGEDLEDNISVARLKAMLSALEKSMQRELEDLDRVYDQHFMTLKFKVKKMKSDQYQSMWQGAVQIGVDKAKALKKEIQEQSSRAPQK